MNYLMLLQRGILCAIPYTYLLILSNGAAREASVIKKKKTLWEIQL